MLLKGIVFFGAILILAFVVGIRMIRHLDNTMPSGKKRCLWMLATIMLTTTVGMFSIDSLFDLVLKPANYATIQKSAENGIVAICIGLCAAIYSNIFNGEVYPSDI